MFAEWFLDPKQFGVDGKPLGDALDDQARGLLD